MPGQRESREEADDTVLVALTRPPMSWGIPFEAFLCCPLVAFVSIVGFLKLFPNSLLGPLFAVLAIGGEFLAFRALTAWSLHFARRISLWVATASGDLSARLFGGLSTGPQRAALPTSARDIPLGV